MNFKDLSGIFSAYTERLQKVDKLQRNFEQAVADSDGQCDPLSEFIDVTRKQYLEFIENIQRPLLSSSRRKAGLQVISCAIRRCLTSLLLLPWRPEKRSHL